MSFKENLEIELFKVVELIIAPKIFSMFSLKYLQSSKRRNPVASSLNIMTCVISYLWLEGLRNHWGPAWAKSYLRKDFYQKPCGSIPDLQKGWDKIPAGSALSWNLNDLVCFNRFFYPKSICPAFCFQSLGFTQLWASHYCICIALTSHSGFAASCCLSNLVFAPHF